MLQKESLMDWKEGAEVRVRAGRGKQNEKRPELESRKVEREDHPEERVR